MVYYMFGVALLCAVVLVIHSLIKPCWLKSFIEKRVQIIAALAITCVFLGIINL